MKLRDIPLFALLAILIFVSCGENSEDPDFVLPESYTFLRDGNSTVSFTGQTTRIAMAEELSSALLDSDKSLEDLLSMYRNEGPNGEDVSPFESSELNDATKSIKSKVAASRDFFSSNTSEASIIKDQFEQWITDQHNEVFPNYEVLAEPGISGQIADGTSTRYVNAKGFENNQIFAKGLIGGLMVDQMLNNYLSTAVLDEADNRINNDNGVVEDGKNYTSMEHKWDEAYGYLFGASASVADPVADIGGDDSFLNKYLGRVDGDVDFSGIALDIFNAFKKGRAAIVARNYDERDAQADIIKELVSEVVAIRTVYYLQQGKLGIPEDGNIALYGTAFHDISEGLGFMYSLRFTRKSGSNEAYFSRTEVDGYIDQLINDSANGLWDVSAETLDDISKDIADKFDFTVAQAAE